MTAFLKPFTFWRHLFGAALLTFAMHAMADGVVDIARDTRFDADRSGVGMNRPRDFVDAGIYMAAPADATKEVVLFIHGANGSPRDFIDVARQLDGSKQQAWFAYYASGGSVAAAGRQLADDVAGMMTSYRITRLRIFAHSVGGLVAWNLIADLEGRITVVQLISVNTPWNGSNAARFGKWLAPSPLALWIDLSPGSKALTMIHRRPLATEFTLVYTVRNDTSASRGDGIVHIGSQTATVMTQRAVEVVKTIGTHSTALHGRHARRMSELLAPDT